MVNPFFILEMGRFNKREYLIMGTEFIIFMTRKEIKSVNQNLKKAFNIKEYISLTMLMDQSKKKIH